MSWQICIQSKKFPEFGDRFASFQFGYSEKLCCISLKIFL